MKKTVLLTAVTSICLTIGMSISAFAGTWVSDSTGWWWANDDGSYPVSTWQWIDGNADGTAECYYFDGRGYLVVNGTTPDGYTVNGNGAWVENGQVRTQAAGTGSRSSSAASSASSSGYFLRDISSKGDCAVINRTDLRDCGDYFEGTATIYANYGAGARAGTYREPIRISKNCYCYWRGENWFYDSYDLMTYLGNHTHIRMFEADHDFDGLIVSFEDGVDYMDEE